MKKESIIITALLTMSITVSASALEIPTLEETQEPQETLYTCIYNNIQVSITENPATMFKDISGKEWFTSYLQAPIHFGVLSGYEDETLRPDNNITCAEVAKVMASTFENDTDERSKVWYAKYYNRVAKGFTYTDLDINDEYFGREMTRCEIAYVIANYVSGGNGYTADLSSLSAFADCGLIGTDDDGTMSKDIEIINAGYIPSRYAKALAYLVDKGVFQGYEDEVTGVRTLNPTGKVTRAEVFTLLMNLCKATPSYNYGQFTGNMNIEYIEDEQTPVQTPVQTQKPSKPSHSSNGGAFDGDKELAAADCEPYAEYMARENITARWDDPSRPRLKAGDTFIAEDGTAYVLEMGPSGVLGEGLPVALDLGRSITVKGVTETIYHGFKPSYEAFGWMTMPQGYELNLSSQTYYVNSRTGEGHWDKEWGLICRNTKPSGTASNGEYSSDGNWEYSEAKGDWIFIGRQ